MVAGRARGDCAIPWRPRSLHEGGIVTGSPQGGKAGSSSGVREAAASPQRQARASIPRDGSPLLGAAGSPYFRTFGFLAPALDLGYSRKRQGEYSHAAFPLPLQPRPPRNVGA